MSGRWIYFVFAAVLVSASINLIPQEQALLWLGAQFVAWAHLGWAAWRIEEAAYLVGLQRGSIWWTQVFDEEETEA